MPTTYSLADDNPANELFNATKVVILVGSCNYFRIFVLLI